MKGFMSIYEIKDKLKAPMFIVRDYVHMGLLPPPSKRIHKAKDRGNWWSTKEVIKHLPKIREFEASSEFSGRYKSIEEKRNDEFKTTPSYCLFNQVCNRIMRR